MSAVVARGFQRARVFVLAGCVLSLLWGDQLSAQLEVDQLEVFVSSVGRDRAATFRVRNTAAEAVTARLSVGDWARANDGTNLFSDPGTVDGGCSDRIELFPQVASLGVGESQVVRVAYTGDSLSTMCWASVLVGVAPRPAQDAGGASVATEVRSAVKVYVAPVVTTLSVRVEELDVGSHRPVRGESAADTLGSDVIALFQNHGNVHVRAKVRVEYRLGADSVVARAEDDDVPMLPGASRVWRTPLPALPPGRYLVLVVVDFGGPELVAGQIELEMTP